MIFKEKHYPAGQADLQGMFLNWSQDKLWNNISLCVHQCSHWGFTCLCGHPCLSVKQEVPHGDNVSPDAEEDNATAVISLPLQPGEQVQHQGGPPSETFGFLAHSQLLLHTLR